MTETREAYDVGETPMRYGDETYRRKLRRYQELCWLDRLTWREARERLRLNQELTACELQGRGLRGMVEDYERALELGDMSGAEE